MRSADATPPSRRPRSQRTRSTLRARSAVVLLLIALMIPALPLSNPTNAQSDGPNQPVNPTVAVTAGNPSPDPSSDSTSQVADATLFPATEVTEEPLSSARDNPLPSPAELPLEEPTGIPSMIEPAVPSAPPFTADPADLSVSSEEVMVNAADVGLPVVCQLVLAVTAVPPAPGKTVNDPLPDPVAGATFTVSNVGGDSITMVSDSAGTVNLHTDALRANGLLVSTGDQVTVTQTGTRSGLSLGEPAFTSTFTWQSAFSSTCRVEAFVVNPVIAQPPSPSAIASASPSLASSALPSMSPLPSASASALAPPSILPSPTTTPSPSPTATIPVGSGQIEVWTVARPSAAGQTPVRLAGGRFSIVERIDHTIVTRMTTGADGTALSPLLPLGNYDLILDAPPPGYLGAQARAFSVSSPTLQRIVFEMDADPNPPTTRTPPASPNPSARASASPSAPATNTPRATETRTPETTTPQSTATTRASSTPQATVTPGATARPSLPNQTPTAAARPPRSTSTAIGTATSRPATATVRPGTTTPTSRPATATATTKPMTGTATRLPRATAPAGTTATAAPSPQTPAATATRSASTGTPTRAPRATATIQSSPTRATQFTEARITVAVSICIDPRFTDSGEFGSMTDIDRSRCRSARSGETRITLTSTYPTYLPRYAQTTSTDSAGRVTFIFPPTREDRIGNLHLEGPINVEDAGVRIYSGRTLVIPLTIVVRDPNAPPIGSAGAVTTSGVDSWSFAAAPGVLLAGVAAAWRHGRTRRSTRLRD